VPIGQRFLRRVLLQFKFEINLGIAPIVLVPGMLWWSHKSSALTARTGWMGAAGAVVLIVYLFWEAIRDSRFLATLRHQMLEQLHENASTDAEETGCLTWLV
jgi:hypothetical protein